MDARLEKIGCHNIQHNDTQHKELMTLRISTKSSYAVCHYGLSRYADAAFFIGSLNVFILSVVLPLAEAKVLKNFILGRVTYFLLIVQ